MHGRSGATPNRFWSADVLCFFIILFVSFNMINGVEKIIDLELFDEPFYMFWGINYFKGIINNSDVMLYAPIYALWYKGLSFFEPNNIRLFYLNYKLLIFLPYLFLLFFSGISSGISSGKDNLSEHEMESAPVEKIPN